MYEFPIALDFTCSLVARGDKIEGETLTVTEGSMIALGQILKVVISNINCLFSLNLILRYFFILVFIIILLKGDGTHNHCV